MKKIILIIAMAAMPLLSIHASGSCCPSKKNAVSVVKVCTSCGEVKGSDKCCKADAAKCKKCDLNKGSIGCCKKLEAPEGKKVVKLCAKCGEVKGSGKCCKADAAKCSKCNLNKGAPGCCKLPK